MVVNVSGDEIEIFRKRGFSPEKIKGDVDAYRAQGLDDAAIRSKIDSRLASWNEEDNPKPLTPMDSALESLRGDFSDIGYGARKALSGLSLGATDWAARKLGINDEDYLADVERRGASPTAANIAGIASEIGGNIIGPGKSIIGALSKKGLTGAKLAAAAGGVEGAAYGLTGSDDLRSVLPNVVLGGSSGAALGGIGEKILSPVMKNVAPKISNALRTKNKILINELNNVNIPDGSVWQKGLSSYNDLVKYLETKGSAIDGTLDSRYIVLPNGKQIRISNHAPFYNRSLKADLDFYNITPNKDSIAKLINEKAKKIPKFKANTVYTYGYPEEITFNNVQKFNKLTNNQLLKLYETRGKRTDPTLYLALQKRGMLTNDALAETLRKFPTSQRTIDRYKKAFDMLTSAPVTSEVPVVAAPLAELAGGVNKNLIKAVRGLEKDIGADKIDELVSAMRASGRSAAEVGDEAVLRALQTARQKTPEAGDIIEREMRNRFDAQFDRNYAKVNEVFGKRSKGQNIDAIVDETKKRAYPIYDRLNKIGDLVDYEIKNVMERRNVGPERIGKILQDKSMKVDNAGNLKYSPSNSGEWNRTNLGKYVKNNDEIQRIVKNIKKDPVYRREYSKLADTDFKVLEKVKQNLDDQISREVDSITQKMSNRGYDLTYIKNQLLGNMDEVIPEYKTARGVYEAKSKALAAQKVGEDALKANMSVEDLARKMRDMKPFERQSLITGMRKSVLDKVGSRDNEAMALSSLLGENAKNKLRLVLGKKDANDFIKHAVEEVKANRNMGKILSGSQTSEKVGLREGTEKAIAIGRNPTGFIGEFIDVAQAPFVRKNNIAMADALTKAKVDDIVAALREIRKAEDPRFAQIAAALASQPANAIASGTRD